ncbi:hypothetical protein WA171_000928, partial [Blastocystis sp. BT1]
MYLRKIETEENSLDFENPVLKREKGHSPRDSSKKTKIPALSSSDAQQTSLSEMVERERFDLGILPIESGIVTGDGDCGLNEEDRLDISMGIKLATAVSMKPISLETESEPPLEHEELLPERALLPIEPLSDSDFD